jgi:hypothetical protein
MALSPGGKGLIYAVAVFAPFNRRGDHMESMQEPCGIWTRTRTPDCVASGERRTAHMGFAATKFL